MNANSTSVFPPTVRRMHAAKQIAINIVCHKANGGSTGVGPLVDVGKSLAKSVLLGSWNSPIDPLRSGKPIKLVLLLLPLARIHCEICSSLQRWLSICEHCW